MSHRQFQTSTMPDQWECLYNTDGLTYENLCEKTFVLNLTNGNTDCRFTWISLANTFTYNVK